MASYPGNPYPQISSSSMSASREMLDSDVDVEDEVDQLDSDSEGDDAGNSPSAKKNDTTAGQRVPGESLLPAVRLQNIIQAEGVTGALALSKEGLFILSIATEEFIKRMAGAGHLKATSERRMTVDYGDMAAATQQYQEFMFLDDTIPAPVSLAEALTMREDKERELFEDDPAMSTSNTPSHRHSTKSGYKPYMQSRNWFLINGHPHKNGSSNSGKRERKLKEEASGDDADPNRLWAEGSAARAAVNYYYPPSQNGRSSGQGAATRPPPSANGHRSASSSRSGTITPARDESVVQPTNPLPPSRPLAPATPEDGPWASQLSDPTSGFLAGPGGPFNHTAQNPGRTIYSQQHRPES